MFKYKKGQSAIEFVLVVGSALFFFTLFLAVVFESSSTKAKENKMIILEDIASSVRDEINLAHSSTIGYRRNFSLPTRVGNYEYVISLVADSVYIVSEKDALSLNILPVMGEIRKGENIIIKNSTGVFLNE